ncbi:MAG: aryl-sulfate sulfotransferase, partial [Desulfofustis sp.]|nr:aryl-sulfate sulfotransferase [Desulfofustis sp.]
MSYPSVYPTGTTIFKPEKCFSGYTIFQAKEVGALLIDMSGAEVQLWKNLHGFPNKLLPGGYVMGHLAERNNKYGMQDQTDLVQVDWDGNIVWKFDQYEYIEDPGEDPQWMARQHHDYQREGNPVGYYVPGMDPKVDSGTTLILSHKNLYNKEITDKKLLDDVIIEVDWNGDIIWEWILSEHFDEFDFSEEAKNILFRDPNFRAAGGGMGDWMHVNSMSALGPNRFYDAGDERFHPENIIWDARETNITAITDKQSGKIVWSVGPDYNTSPELKELGWIIGQHHAHMIPQGLPGEGNILVFDNGGWAGYGAPNPGAPTGAKNALRDFSRVLEFDPVTLKIIWQYTPTEAGYLQPVDANRFYSPFISSAQRLPNGNTLITEGSGGRIIEVTKDHEIVWEYISPYWGRQMNINMIYRAYRVPY